MSQNETHDSNVRPGSEESEPEPLENQDPEPRGSEEEAEKKEHEGSGSVSQGDTDVDNEGRGDKLEELSDDWPEETGSREEEPRFEGESRERSEEQGPPHRVQYQHQPPYPSYPYPAMPRDGQRYQRKKIYLQTVVFPLVVFSLLFISWLSALMVLYADTGSGSEDDGAELRIEEVFFQLEDIDEEQEYVTINISLYITNYGNEKSGDLLLNIYAQNKQNDLIYDRANKTVGAIDAEKTVEAIIPIQLPTNNSFRIRVFLFEDDMITITGYGEISLSSVSQTVVDFTTGEGGANGGSAQMKEDEDKAGAFAADSTCGVVLVVGLVLVLVIAAGVAVYRSERRWKP